MTRIAIPFNEWSMERLLDGRKTATSRNKRYGKTGDVFIVRNRLFKLINVSKKKLIEVCVFYYREEGCDGQDEFIKIWKSIHPRNGWEPDKYIWFHEFVEELK